MMSPASMIPMPSCSRWRRNSALLICRAMYCSLSVVNMTSTGGFLQPIGARVGRPQLFEHLGMHRAGARHLAPLVHGHVGERGERDGEEQQHERNSRRRDGENERPEA